MLRVDLSAVSNVGKTIRFSLSLMYKLDKLVISVLYVLLSFIDVTNANQSPEDRSERVVWIRKHQQNSLKFRV